MPNNTIADHDRLAISGDADRASEAHPASSGSIVLARTVELRPFTQGASPAVAALGQADQEGGKRTDLDAQSIERSLSPYAEIEAIFTNPIQRPSPELMMKLINAGMTEADLKSVWLSLGHEIPMMDLTLADLDSALPYVSRMTDELSRSHQTGERLLFAGRDADTLYDYFAISHPDVPADLLPASGTMWHSPSMRNNGLARRFFERHLLDEQHVKDPDTAYKIVDTGFAGTIKKRVVNGLKATFGKRAINSDKFSVEMVCANDNADGSQIVDVPGTANDLQEQFPKVTACLGPAISRYFGRNSSSTIPLAVSMQLLPRYHGPYESIAEIGNEVCAIPNVKEISDNVDTPMHATAADSTIINPLAASIVQYRVVQHAAMHRQAMQP